MSLLPPIKNTVGEGFTVEERIVAWLACHLLSGTPWPPSESALIQFIDCQARQDGWFFDDTVVTCQTPGSSRKCGCSIKSFPVFGPEGAPADFARTLWSQWNHKSETGFQRETDRLVLISAQHTPEIREAWFGLTEEAKVIPADTFASRFERSAEPSALRRSAFASLQRPIEEGGATHTDREVAELLGRFALIELDFEHAGSLGLTTAHSMCQQVLADSARSRANELWDAILAFTAEIRRKGGRVAVPQLLDGLAHRFPLKNHPSFAADWDSITASSQERIAAIVSKINGRVSIERSALAGQLEGESAQPEPHPMLGGSGSGKSVLAHNWARTAGSNAVWLTAADLTAQGGLRALFGLTHGISELFAGAPGPCRLIIDGLDRCFGEAAFSQAALVLRAALAPDCKNRWRILLTCRPEDWERVRGELTRREIPCSDKPVQVGWFSAADLLKIAQDLPALSEVLRRPHLSPILRWPKALDIIATNLDPGETPVTFTTESALAIWFWDRAIRTGNSGIIRDRVARKLGSELGDRMSPGLALASFPNDEAAILQDLAKEGHLAIDTRSRSVRFAHDLIADWARQAELQSLGSAVGAFLRSRLSSPLWHRAIRFHALELLESNPGTSQWEALFQQFPSDSPDDIIAQNLLLEAPIFAVEQHGALLRLWPILIRNKGALLRRFLRQFLQAATLPDERKIAQITAGNPELARHAATLLRYPWPPYWFGILQILGEHAEEATVLAPDDVAEICLKWLPLRHLTSEGMQTAARLAVTSAKAFAEGEKRQRFSHLADSTEEKICQALLAASYELPDEVAELALDLSGRHPEPNLEPTSEAKQPRRPRIYFERGRPRPWPEGPQSDCNPVFRKVFMHQMRSAAFLDALSEVAAEVMFSVLLDLPHENDAERSSSFDLDERGFARGDLDFHSCFWTNGPYLTFLRLNPAVALPAIIRLVNFASERACELPPSARQFFQVAITVEGKVHPWKGHQYSYFWHKGHVFGPKSVGCALLSLEKWLYDLMDKQEPLDEHLLTIMRESRSIALAAVLICVGKRRPELFQGPLRPLLDVPEFHHIEALDFRMNGGSFRDTANNESSTMVNDLLHEWVSMPHRKRPLDEQILLLTFKDDTWRTLMEEVRGKWLRRLDADSERGPPWLENLIYKFDTKNWRYHVVDGNYEFSFVPPESASKPPKEVVDRLERMSRLMLLPFQCEQILEGKKECPIEQLEDWWSQIEVIRTTAVPAEAEDIQNPANTLCGIVAVAVVRHRAWLAADPAREKEALSILRKVFSNPPANAWFFDFESTHNRWDTFAACAITTLWCEKCDDPFLTESVASLAMWRRYVVVERVLMVAAEHRDKLGTVFDRLLAHAIRYAPVRDRFRHKAQAPAPADDDPELRRWRSEQIKRFRAGKTKRLPVSWLELAEPTEVPTHSRPIKSTGLDIDQIHSALTWATDLSKARNPEERQVWLRYQREYLLCALIRIDMLPTDEKDDPLGTYQRHLPYRDEDHALERIGTITAHLNADDDHRGLWEPILRLGTKAAPWIRHFISRWMLEGAGHRTLGFIDQWKAMLAYAESSPAWKDPGRRRRDGDEMWHHLLSFSPATRSFWDKELAPAVVAVRNSIERWAADNVSSRHEADTYIHFLLREAARPLRVSGLIILRKKAPPEPPRSWTDALSQSALASLLDLILDDDWSETVSTPEAMEAFMAFALKLVSLQNPLGTELLAGAKAKLTDATAT